MMRMMRTTTKKNKKSEQSKSAPSYVYYVEEGHDPTFFPGRCAYIYLNDLRIGSFGIVHPSVCKNFDIVHPTSALEINLEHFLEIE